MIRYGLKSTAEIMGADHHFRTIKARNAVRDAASARLSVRRRRSRGKSDATFVMGRDTLLKYRLKRMRCTTAWRRLDSGQYESDDDVKSVIDVAKGLEGLKRSDGIHAEAVVITKEPVTETSNSTQTREWASEDAPLHTQHESAQPKISLLKMTSLSST